jgi:hypothetical protein
VYRGVSGMVNRKYRAIKAGTHPIPMIVRQAWSTPWRWLRDSLRIFDLKATTAMMETIPDATRSQRVSSEAGVSRYSRFPHP